MKHDLKNLCNDGLINSCKKIAELIPTQLESDHLTELITRFERLSLGQQADEAIQELEELQQEKPTRTELEVLKEVEYLFSLFSDHSIDCMGYRSLCEKIKKLEGASPLQQPTLETSRDFIISKDSPVKKVQENDEVEALARELWVMGNEFAKIGETLTDGMSWQEIEDWYSSDNYPTFGGPFTDAMSPFEWLKFHFTPPKRRN
jgi:hypothetical protein